MRCLVQRVTSASVTVEGDVIATIAPGLCVFVGVTHDDSPEIAARMADKVWHLRVFEDGSGTMNRSLAETSREVLVVSQFTLYGDTSRGRRPSWSDAAPPEVARPLVDAFVDELEQRGAHVATGRFGAEMQVALVNDGPVTLLVEVSRTT